MNEETIRSLTREECLKKLVEIGQYASGSVDEMKMKLRKFCLYPNLYEKLKRKSQRSYSFKCSLNPIDIPPINAKWDSRESLYPVVDESMFLKYSSLKHEGSQGQQEKALRMLQSRKIVSVKCLIENEKIYVKAMIRKSYGTEIRPAVILFDNRVPLKSHCRCPVGLSGLCCHVLSLLLYLKHFYCKKEKLLELTCTEQLQKWHRRSKKGSIPMVPLNEIKAKSATMKTKDNKISIEAADPGHSYFKRDVPSIISLLEHKLEQEKKPVGQHIQSVLLQSDVGRKSSVGQLLEYRYHNKVADALADHIYCKTPLFNQNVLFIDPDKSNQIQTYVDKKYNILQSKCTSRNTTIDFNLNILTQNEQEIQQVNSKTMFDDKFHNHFLRNLNSQLSGSQNNPVMLNLSSLVAPKPFGDNYEDVLQNTDKWHEIRKYKVTGSRLPALLGFHGQKKLSETLSLVKNGTAEPKLNHINNIARGNMYENEALLCFQADSQCKVEKCGFFYHPENKRYGASPDAIGPNSILVEIKTRAEKCDGPIESIEKYPHYFIQCQLQMVCTNAKFCILQSYHPETKKSNYFLIKCNNTLIKVVTDVIDCLYDNIPLLQWLHNDVEELKSFGEVILGKVPNFEYLRSLRGFIKKCVKSVPKVEFHV